MMKARFEIAIVGVVGPRCVVESAGARNEAVRITPPNGDPFEIAYEDLFALLRSLPGPEVEVFGDQVGGFMTPPRSLRPR